MESLVELLFSQRLSGEHSLDQNAHEVYVPLRSLLPVVSAMLADNPRLSFPCYYRIGLASPKNTRLDPLARRLALDSRNSCQLGYVRVGAGGHEAVIFFALPFSGE
jgi:hypothetical protein